MSLLSEDRPPTDSSLGRTTTASGSSYENSPSDSEDETPEPGSILAHEIEHVTPTKFSPGLNNAVELAYLEQLIGQWTRRYSMVRGTQVQDTQLSKDDKGKIRTIWTMLQELRLKTTCEIHYAKTKEDEYRSEIAKIRNEHEKDLDCEGFWKSFDGQSRKPHVSELL